MKEYQVDSATLALRISGLLPEDGSHIRQVLFDEIESRLPRDPEARINIQLSELNPGRTASWHVHNGIVYFVLLRGIVSLQYEDEPSTTRRVTSTPSQSESCTVPTIPIPRSRPP